MRLDMEIIKEPGVSKIRRWIGLAVCVVLFTILIAFAAGRYRTFRVTSGSMEPTIRVGDVILVKAGASVELRRGNVVAVKNPKDTGDWLCKRVVAVPGDTIMFYRGYLYRNEEIQDREPYVSAHRIEGLPDVPPYLLKPTEYFVLGDNRPVSYDSLDFGPVPREDFIGVALAVYWPWARRKWLTGDGR